MEVERAAFSVNKPQYRKWAMRATDGATVQVSAVKSDPCSPLAAFLFFAEALCGAYIGHRRAFA